MKVRLRFPLLAAALLAGLAPAVRAEDDSAARIDALIGRGMEESFSGRWAEAKATFRSIRDVDPSHPAWAFYPPTVDYWEMHEDYSNPAYYPPIFEGLEKAAALAEARVERNGRDAEALAYWGQALVHLGRHKAFLGDYVDGGATGEEGRKKLERALALRPDLADAKCPLGSYNYLAGSLPGLARALDFLWFVPSGDRAEGLRLLEECRRDGRNHVLEAELLLFNILARWEKGGAERAYAVGRALRARFPENAGIHIDLPRLRLELGDPAGALAEADAVLARVRAGAPAYDRKIEALALFWKARALLIARDYDAARETVAALAALEPARPLWMRSWTLVTQGQIEDLRGRRVEALALYRAAAEMEAPFRAADAAEEAERRLDEPYLVPAL